MSDALLQMNNIKKSFPGVKALDGVSFTLNKGSVHALMGENGAGKSTLMKILFGIYEMDEGEIMLEGRKIKFKSPKDALMGGVAMVHQELSQAQRRTVADNIWLGRYPKSLGFITRDGKMYSDTEKIFNELGIVANPKAILGTLSVAQRQMIEIAKAVSYNARVIVLDEPTSSLSESEAEKLFSIIDRLKSRGCGIIYISHKMEEILRICDTVTVMRDGKHIKTAPASELDIDKIISLMVGRDMDERFPEKTNTPGKVYLRVENLSSKYQNVEDVSFYARRGEVLGFAGLDGAGRSQLFENIFGISERQCGKIYLDDKEIKNRNPRESIKNGFAFLTEERRSTGIFSILDICENTTVSSLKKYRRGIYISESERRRDTDSQIKDMRVKTPSRRTKIRSLSGGNQQKVILSRWVLTNPEILILDEPTRGIDVGAKYEIYKIIDSLASSGKCVIVISSELVELFGVCDRIYVMSDGKIAGEVDPESSNQESVMALATKFI